MKPVESFDRRVFGRRQTNISAKVRIGYRIVSCVIKDISEGGALLEFAEPLDLPVRIWLSWPDQSAEIVCDVRHQRRNTAGVQFSRPQAVTLRPAVAPPEPVAASPAPAKLRVNATGASGADLVAQRRASFRPAQAVSAEAVIPASQATEPPRDLSTLMQSLNAAAEAIVSARAARAVPHPLKASAYVGAIITPAEHATPLWAVRPLPAHDLFIISEITQPRPRRGLSLRQLVQVAKTRQASHQAPANSVRPLAAARFAGAVVMPPRMALLSGVPLPLSASAYGVREALDTPPSPLPAGSYAAAIARGCIDSQ